MTLLEGFRLVTELTADDRARIAFGKVGVHKDERYAVSVSDEGAILLTPVVSIPKREQPVWENDKLRASLFRGLADAAEGRVRGMDWVTNGNDVDGE